MPKCILRIITSDLKLRKQLDGRTTHLVVAIYENVLNRRKPSYYTNAGAPSSLYVG